MISTVNTAFIAVASIFLLSFSLYHHLSPTTPAAVLFLAPPVSNSYSSKSNALLQQEPDPIRHVIHRHVITPNTVSILLPGWEILVIAAPPLAGNLSCFFPNDQSSPARLTRTLTFYKCDLPERFRRGRLPQPILSATPGNPADFPTAELLRYNYLAYDSLTTEHDVVLFVKGINNRQGVSRPISQLTCLVGGVRSAAVTAVGEVFRCRLPNSTADFGAKITLETKSETAHVIEIVPSVAHYSPRRMLVNSQSKSLICACTMVYNSAKFLKEWVTYHSSIGVDKFVIYDNDSDDNLSEVITELIDKGFDISAEFWIWPKTQEAGFSHCAVMYNDTCTWMMYVDVDEFVYSPKWGEESGPSVGMLRSMVDGAREGMTGQVMIGCYEFGPSDQRENPTMGVTQGYNCRRKEVNRHKSIVLLDAVDESLHNVIHHFQLKPGYRSMQMKVEDAIVNHYKYQAWSEFKSKYRRRVSAYVVDWTRAVNLGSKDRAPGLGVVPVEPDNWPRKFCEIYDNNLKDLTRLWFGHQSSVGHYMAWQR